MLPSFFFIFFSFFLTHHLIFFWFHLFVSHACMFPPLFVSSPFFSFFFERTHFLLCCLTHFSTGLIFGFHYPSLSKVWSAVTRCWTLQPFLLLSPCRWAEAVPGSDPRHRATAGDSPAMAQWTPQPPRQLPAHLHHPHPLRLTRSTPPSLSPWRLSSRPARRLDIPGNCIASRRKLREQTLQRDEDQNLFTEH